MAVFLIRHAHAGTRGAFDGPDEARPLDGRGRAQAESILALLNDRDVRRIYSSPAARCIETVQPLAEKMGVEVETRPELREGADARDIIALLDKHAARNVAICAHGDVIPGVIRRLRTNGLRIKGKHANQKGSVWEIEVDHAGHFTRARYTPPST